MRVTTTVFAMLISMMSFSQKVDWKKIKSQVPDSILQTGAIKPSKVLLIGSFHFDYPNLDAHKTDSANYIDVLSPSRQREIAELASVIERFKPTRVYIESRNQRYHDSLFNQYLQGQYKLGRSELYQVAYRVAKAAGLKKVHTVDASNFAAENSKKYTWIDSLWNNPRSADTNRNKVWSKLYNRFYNYGDSLDKKFTMLESFLMMAEPDVLRRGHGAYLIGDFNTTDDSGPDLLSIWWYNRNLRIFNKILNSRPGPDDRIMVLFGNGHVPILKHCFESSPEFQVVELKSLLK